MKRILSLLLGLTLCFSLVTTVFAASASDFRDYKRKAWYSESMDAAVKNGLLRGDDQGLLRPDGNLTRAEMAAIMNRAFGAYQTEAQRHGSCRPAGIGGGRDRGHGK